MAMKRLNGLAAGVGAMVLAGLAAAQEGVPEVGIPGLDAVDHQLEAPALMREGTFLVDRRGTVLRLSTGEWVFVFHRDEAGGADPPMLLLPCSRLSVIAHIAESEPGTVFMLSGQVFAYGERNYLLPTMHRVAPGGEAQRDPDAVGPLGDDPSAEAIIRDLESRGDARRLAARPVEAASGGGDIGGLREGEVLFRRRARMARQAAGEWAIVFDNDLDAGGRQPLIPLPCLALEELERSVSAAEDGIVVEVSGRVFTYAYRGYLIPTLVVRERPSDVMPRQ